MIEKLTFHNHPLKSEIIERWEKGQTSQHICEWLKLSHSEITLSQPTLAKHYKRFRANKRRLESSENKVSLKEPVKEIILDLEEKDIKEFLDDLKAVTKAEKISFGKKLKITL